MTGMNPICRLLPSMTLPGPEQMAVDEALLESAAAGVATLRFYRWSEPTLSLGYFQKHLDRLNDPLLTTVAWVRRSSGGGAILHHHELTYALAVPAGSDWNDARTWTQRMHGTIQDLLRGQWCVCVDLCETDEVRGPFLCFDHLTPGDLTLTGLKVTGSAQRKLRGATLQHGSVLLDTSEFTPSLPGINQLWGTGIAFDDLSDALRDRFESETGWTLEPGTLTDAETEAMARIVAEKYGSAVWNEKR